MKRRGIVNLMKAVTGALICGCLTVCAGIVPVHAQETGYQLNSVTTGEIRYGQKLKECSLTGVVCDSAGQVMKGSLTWMEPEKVMLQAGQISEEVLFTPEQTEPVLPPAETEPSGETPPPKETEPSKESESSEIPVQNKEKGPSEGPRETGNGTEEAAGQTEGHEFSRQQERTQQQNQIKFWVIVTVGKGKTEVTWPVVSVKRQIYDGDISGDVLSLQGPGTAVCKVASTVPGAKAVQEEAVPGNFEIKPRDAKLEAGKQTVELIFTPDNIIQYERCSREIEVEVEPRPVPLKLFEVETPLQTGQEISLTAMIRKEKGLDNANGKVTFYVNEQAAAELPLTEKQNGWEAETTWSPSEAGEYKIQAVYMPEDSHTARTESVMRTVLAVDPMTAVRTEDLPEGEEGSEYEAKIETDASGEIALQFSVTRGQLPRGLMLDQKNGRISGLPEEAGRFSFTLMAKEGTITVSREYTLFIRKKEKLQPKLKVSASPEKITGGGDVTLKIEIEDPEDAEKKKDLPSAFSVSFDRAVKTRQPAEGKDGSYTYIFTVGNENGKIRCTVRSVENDFYTSAETYVDVEAVKEEEPEEKPSEKPSEKPKEPEKKKEEEEPVKKTPEEIEAEFWQDVVFRIYKAQEKGDTVTINAKGHKAVPDKVLDALRTHDRVTLALVWEGDMIVIPAQKAPAYQKGVTDWSLADLSKQYPLAKPAPVPAPAPAPAAPEKPAVKPPFQGSGQNAHKENQGGIIIHEKAEPETEQQTETESTVSETEEEPESVDSGKETVPVVSVPEIQEEKGGMKIDWFLVAACICAGTGIIAVTTAIAAMVRKKR